MHWSFGIEIGELNGPGNDWCCSQQHQVITFFPPYEGLGLESVLKLSCA